MGATMSGQDQKSEATSDINESSNLVNYGSEMEGTDVEDSDAEDETYHTRWPKLVRPVYTCSDEEFEKDLDEMFGDTSGSEYDTSSGSEVDEDRLSKYVYREPYSDSDESFDEIDETLSESNESQTYIFDWKPIQNTRNIKPGLKKPNSQNKKGTSSEETQNEEDTPGGNSKVSENPSNEKIQNEEDTPGGNSKALENSSSEKTQNEEDTRGGNSKALENSSSEKTQNEEDTPGGNSKALENLSSEKIQNEEDTSGGNSKALENPSNEKTQIEEDTSGGNNKASENPKNENDITEASFKNSKNRREKFCDTNIGPTKVYANPYEAFTAIWDQKIMELIVNETNRYARQLKIDQWQDTTIDEMYMYFGVILLSSIVVIDIMKYYWIPSDELFAVPHFQYSISYERFKQLTNCIHFCDNNKLNEIKNAINNSEAKLYKLQPLVNCLNEKFSTLYNVGQHIVLDEGLTQWKGWIVNTRKIGIEPDPVEIKSVEICEPNTGYLWRIELYPNDITTEMIPGIVVELLKGLEGKGHTVWMDKFYSSPLLARQLKQLGFDCAGLIHKSYLPSEVLESVKKIISNGKKKRKNMSAIYGSTSGDVDIFAWLTKNRCTNFITTYHGAKRVKSGNLKTPKIMLHYNKITQGVHRKDNLLFSFPMERKRAHVWYKMFFRRLLNASVLNANILYNKKGLKHYTFRQKLCSQIFNRHRSQSPSASFPPDSAGLHFAAPYALMTNQRQTENKCFSCENMTEWYCHLCKYPLCESPCFNKFHSDSNEDGSDNNDSDHHDYQPVASSRDV